MPVKVVSTTIDVADQWAYSSRADMIPRRTTTKADLIEQLYEKVGGFSKSDAADAVQIVFDTIKETLVGGENLKLSGFGVFVVRDKNARVGRNPQTGEALTIAARRVLTFKVSAVLKNAINR